MLALEAVRDEERELVPEVLEARREAMGEPARRKDDDLASADVAVVGEAEGSSESVIAKESSLSAEAAEPGAFWS